MKRPNTSLLTLAITAALAAGTAQAQSGASSPSTSGGAAAQSQGTTPAPGTRAGAPSGKSDLSAADKRFIEDAAKGGMAEVQAGQLAAQKAQSPQVRSFAQMMVDDHTKANAELMQLASARNMTPPAELDRSHRSAMEKLQKQSGAEFDREYMKQQVADHKKTVALFEKQAKSGQDPQLKAWAEKTLPTLREHLKMAQNNESQASSAKPGMGASATPGTSGTGAAASRDGASTGSASASGTSGATGTSGTRAPAGASPAGTTGATGASGASPSSGSTTGGAGSGK
jgi:putative membrane protein